MPFVILMSKQDSEFSLVVLYVQVYENCPEVHLTFHQNSHEKKKTQQFRTLGPLHPICVPSVSVRMLSQLKAQRNLFKKVFLIIILYYLRI